MVQHAKEAAPALSGGEVVPARLRALLERGLEKGLTLIVGPAGSGKTALAAWLARSAESCEGWRVCWIAVSPLDSLLEPGAFRKKIAASLRCAIAAEGAPALQDADILPAIEQGPAHLACFIDNIHLVEGSDNAALVSKLVDTAPANMHMIVAGRKNPGIPLSRARMEERLVEVTAADMAFTEAEADRFLRSRLPDSHARDRQRIYELTRGWVAGMHLISLQIKNSESPRSALDGLPDSCPWLADFLAEEILPDLGEEARSFLSLTCMLECFNRALCDEVVGLERSERIMAELLAANLLQPAEREGGRRSADWYRYNPLFVGSLKRRMFAELSSSAIKETVSAAIDWYEREGCYDLAVKLSLEQGMYDRAFSLVTDHLYPILTHVDSSVFLQWIEEMPHPQGDASLYCLINAWANFIGGKTKRAQIWLKQVEPGLSDLSSASHRGMASVYKAVKVGSMVFSGEYHKAIEVGAASLDNLGGPQLFLRCTIMHNMGEAFERLGRYRDAYEYFARAKVNAEMAGRRTIELLCAYEISWLQFIEGKLDAASNTALRTLAGCDQGEWQTSWPVGLLQVALARIYLRWGDVERALSYIDQALKILGPQTNCDGYLEAQVALAECRRVQERMDDAEDILLGACEMLEADKVPRGVDLLVLAFYADTLIDRQKTAEARRVVGDARIRMCNEDAFYGIALSMAEARIEIAEGNLARAEAMLCDAGNDAAASDLGLLQRESTLLRAAAARANGRRDEAIDLMASVLDDAFQEDDIGMFARGLSGADSLAYEIAYATNDNRVLAGRRAKAREFAQTIVGRRNRTADAAQGSDSSARPALALSQREKQVYELLKKGSTRKQIAGALGIQVNTVRTHVRNVYQKLGIHDRSLL